MAKSSLKNAEASTSATAQTEEKKRNSKAFVQYVGTVDGAEKVYNFPDVNAFAVRTTFANNIVRDVNVDGLRPEIQRLALLQGVATRTQRSYQAEKEIDKAIEAYDETVEDLANGVWIEARTGQPKVTMLSQAIVKSLQANGQEVDEARRQAIIEKLKSSEYYDKAMANEHVKSHLAQLKAEAAAERAKEAKKAAKEASPEATASLAEF